MRRTLRGGKGKDFGQPEIKNFGMAARGDKNICGFDVAMNDAFGVCGIEGVGDFDGEGDESLGVERAAGDFVFESCAFQALHGDEGAALMFADVVDGANVGMIQGRSRLRFAAETTESLRVL